MIMITSWFVGIILAYDVPTLSANLDWIGVMTYDYHGSWNSVTGHNSPLYKGEGSKDSTVSLKK